MKLNAKQRLVTANWANDLGDVKSQKIQSLVKQQLAKIVDIKHVLTDGYNEDDAGVEIIFDGKSTSGVAYKQTMDAKSVVALGKLMSSNASMHMELLANDDGELTLIIVGDAD